jgi:hypothetical protein
LSSSSVKFNVKHESEEFFLLRNDWQAEKGRCHQWKWVRHFFLAWLLRYSERWIYCLKPQNRANFCIKRRVNKWKTDSWSLDFDQEGWQKNCKNFWSSSTLRRKLGNEERLRSVDEQLKRRTGRGFETTLRKIT